MGNEIEMGEFFIERDLNFDIISSLLDLRNRSQKNENLILEAGQLNFEKKNELA
ncbi:MAG: hypothetical protein ACTSVU_01995 [Promethearchaeota archaeon]